MGTGQWQLARQCSVLVLVEADLVPEVERLIHIRRYDEHQKTTPTVAAAKRTTETSEVTDKNTA